MNFKQQKLMVLYSKIVMASDLKTLIFKKNYVAASSSPVLRSHLILMQTFKGS